MELFSLGKVCIDPVFYEAALKAPQTDITKYLIRHQSGDWGERQKLGDWGITLDEVNNTAIANEGGFVLSMYTLRHEKHSFLDIADTRLHICTFLKSNGNYTLIGQRHKSWSLTDMMLQMMTVKISDLIACKLTWDMPTLDSVL